MTKLKKFTVLICIILGVVLIATLLCFNKLPAVTYAEEQTPSAEQTPASEEEVDIITRGLYTSITLKLDCGNGKVWATAKNDFTLFPSTVYVNIMLYSSYTPTDDYREMKLESSNTIGDLNMGKTITAEASTGGEAKYWLGRIRYKIDKGDWKEKTVGYVQISASGDLI